MEKKRLSKRAFTLVEVLIVVAILGLLVFEMYRVLDVGNRTYLDDMALLDVQQNVRLAMDAIVRELRASSVAAIDSGDSAHITFTTPKAAGIEFRYIDSNSDAVRDQIIRQNAGATRVLGNNISTVCFCWDGITNACRTDCSNLFTIRIIASKTVHQSPFTFTLIERVRVRNE